MKPKYILLGLLLAGLLWLALAWTEDTSRSQIPATLHSEAAQSLTVDVVPSVPAVDLPQHGAPSRRSASYPAAQHAPSSSDVLPDLSQAQPVQAFGDLRWISPEEADSIRFPEYRSMAKQISSSSVKPRKIKDREDAVMRLDMNLAMALRPTVAFEDAECYYFSGGNTAYPVNDFSCGIVIHKATGSISAWEPLR